MRHCDHASADRERRLCGTDDFKYGFINTDGEALGPFWRPTVTQDKINAVIETTFRRAP